MTRSFALLLIVHLLAGCGEEVVTSGGSAPPPRKQAAAADGGGAATDDASYLYNPAGKRDPFRSFIEASKSEESRPDAPPLQRWDIDRYALRGVIWDTDAPLALLVDPEGTGHSVGLGTIVGRNWGKVTSISQSSVVITEEYQNLDGAIVVKPVTVSFAAEATK